MNILHGLAIRYGWYKQVTNGLPLNVCKTVFGVYFLEGSCKPEDPSELFSFFYEWGQHEVRNEIN